MPPLQQQQEQFLTTANENEALFINLLTTSYAAEAGASEGAMEVASVSGEDAKLHYAHTITLTDAKGQATEYLAVLRHSRIDGNTGKGKLRLDIFENHREHIAGVGSQAIVWNLFATAYQDDTDKLQFKFTSLKQNAIAPISWVIKLFRDTRLNPVVIAKLTPEHISRINAQLKADAMQELAKLEVLGLTSKHELIQIKSERGLICYGIVTRNLGEIDLFNLIKNYYYNIPQALKYQLTAELAWKLIRGCIKAVKEINDKGWVHRDIKPENIMVSISEEGEVEVNLADWSYARELAHYDFEPKGSPVYAAPEVHYDNEGFSQDHFAKLDVYSLGAVIAFLSANASLQGLGNLYKHTERRALSFGPIEFEMRKDFSLPVCNKLKALIHSMLAVNVADRVDMTEVYARAEEIQETWNENKSEVRLLEKPHTNAMVRVDIANGSEATRHTTMSARQITNFFQTVISTERAYNDAVDEEMAIAWERLSVAHKTLSS